MEGTDRSLRMDSSFDSKKKIIDSSDVQNDKENEEKDSETNPNTKVMLESIGEKYFEEVELRTDEQKGKGKHLSVVKKEKEAYLYTDNREYYNVYEEFDMI